MVKPVFTIYKKDLLPSKQQEMVEFFGSDVNYDLPIIEVKLDDGDKTSV